MTEEAPPTLEGLFATCASLTKKSSALKTKTRSLQNVDSEIERQEELNQWLNRQLLDYPHSSHDGEEDEEEEPIKSATQLQKELLHVTCEEHRKRLLSERIRMSASAEAALESDDTKFLTQQALKSRDEVAGQVTKLLTEIQESKAKLEAVTMSCRELQQENRQAWKRVSEARATKESSNDEILLRRRVLMDIILGAHADKLYDNEKLSTLLLSLEGAQ